MRLNKNKKYEINEVNYIRKKYILTKKEIISIVNKICKNSCINFVALFGSYANGTATPDSDIDLLIGLNLDPHSFADVYLRLEGALEKTLDVYFIDHILNNDELKLNFLRNFEVIYQKDKNSFNLLSKIGC